MQINVIIRTTADARREKQLYRAIESIKNQKGVHAIPLIIVNGTTYKKELLAQLLARDDVRCAYIKEASTGKSMRVGRELVNSEFFTFLDDDDELLEEALSIRLKPMLEDPSIDLVVTTGYEVNGTNRQIHIPDIIKCQANPLDAIIERCWLASCGGLYRADSITEDFFDGVTDHIEMTLLAFKIAINNKNILFINQPTYIVNDTPQSMSKSHDHLETTAHVLEQMRRYKMPANIKRKLEKKYRDALHVLSSEYCAQNMPLKAWMFHIRSIKPPFTLKYLAYTRKLLFPSMYMR
jgi:glycosyltransferase involved in cell wall biosynthesis